jgi:hypothetical protein
MTNLYAKVRNRYRIASYRMFQLLGESAEKPLARFAARREMKRLGHSTVELVELEGESELYTWSMSNTDNQPNYVVKASALLGLRHRWRVRKATRLFDYLTPIDRISLIGQRAALLHDAGYGGKPTTDAGNRYSVIEWVNGTPLSDLPCKSHTIQPVISAVIELAKSGIHHGDLHAGNVIISEENRVQLIDSDNKFAHDVSDQTALAVDLAVLVGSLIYIHGPENCVDDKSTVASVVAETVGEKLMAEISEVANEHISENRWLRTAAANL